VLAEDPKTVENDPESEDYLDEEQLARLRKEGGKVSFEEMGKLIGQRWKSLDPDRLGKYSELALEDTERYKKEMQAYNSRQEAKMRSEALKPTTTYPPRQAGKPGMGRGGLPMGPPGMEAHPGIQQGYPMEYSAMQGGYYYGGMDQFGGYNPAAMGMGGVYGPYGGMGGGGVDGSGAQMGGGGGNPNMMAQMGGREQAGMSQGQYDNQGGPMYGMGSFQGGMMGYGYEN